MSLKLASKLDKIEKMIVKHEAEYEHSVNIIKTLDGDIKRLTSTNTRLERVMLIYDYFLNNNTAQINTFADTITAGLRDVFNNKYNFTFNTKKNGSNLVCNFMLQTDKHNYPLELTFSQGDAAKQIIGVILRLLIVKIKSKIKLLILDEPLSGLEVVRQEPVAIFLQDIAKEFNIQLIIISHSPSFTSCADNVIYVG